MSFLKFLRKLKKKESSEEIRAGKARSIAKKNGKVDKVDKDLLGFDLFYQLSYMSAIATSDVPRGKIFEYAARLPCASSAYFEKVLFLTRKLNYDYAEACRIVGESVKEEEVKSLLLRLSGSLSSGEEGTDFLAREASAMADTYGNKYERELESLRKWTDAHSALIISATLIVIVGALSTMIYKMAPAFIMMMAMLAVVVAIIGTYVLYRVAPKEIKPLARGDGSKEQRISSVLFKLLLPTTVVVCSFLMLKGVGLGEILIVAAVLIFPVGFMSDRDDGKITKRDEEIGTFLRSLGGVATAIGTTVTEAMTRVDMRSVAHLESLTRKLRSGLVNLIKPELCWQRFATEAGSELVNRSASMFCDAVNLGGDPGEVGSRSSLYAMKISLLRAKRKLISSSFGWLALVMHVAMVALLVFVSEIMNTFSSAIQSIEMPEMPGNVLSLGSSFAFSFADVQLIHQIVIPTILALTVVDAVAPYVTDGGHKYKVFYNLSLTMLMSGASIILVPKVVTMIFGSIGSIS